MWIKSKTIDLLNEERIRAQERVAILDRMNQALLVNLDWLRVRVNQLEHERAQLLFNYTGVRVAVPEIKKVEEQPAHPLNELLSFADVGDAEAKRLGIEWDGEGNVRYTS